MKPAPIIGGPPCQGFSTLGDRLSSDPRNDLVDAFIRIVDGLRPQAVVIENVQAIATEYRGRYRDFILQRLQDISYTSSFAVLNAADFGVPGEGGAPSLLPSLIPGSRTVSQSPRTATACDRTSLSGKRSWIL